MSVTEVFESSLAEGGEKLLTGFGSIVIFKLESLEHRRTKPLYALIWSDMTAKSQPTTDGALTADENLTAILVSISQGIKSMNKQSNAAN